MAIRQQLAYNSDATYFAGFLQSLIKESGIIGSISQNSKGITLLLDDTDTEELELFSKLTAQNLPHSIFLGAIETYKEDGVVEAGSFISKDYAIAPCPVCLKMVTDPASEAYLDDSLVCTHYSNEGFLRTYDFPSFSPHYSEGDMLLITDPASVSSLFYVTQSEQKALFSIEKPTLKVTIQDETLLEMTGKKFIYVRSSFDIRSTLAALNAKEAGVPYLFFHEIKSLKVSVLKEDVYIIRDNIGVSRSLKAYDSDSVKNRCLNIAEEAGFPSAIAVNMSTQNGITFLFANNTSCKTLLKFQEFDIAEVLNAMEDLPVRSKLLHHFREKFPDAAEALGEAKSDIFEAVCILLELEERSFETLSDKSLEFRGNGGLKIDTDFTDKGFDYVAFLGSIMSFRLAGVETHYLAYSIFEALGDMCITTLNQLKQTYKVENFVMMGDMFENSVLHSRIESKFALSHPYFSRGVALDESQVL